MRRPLLCGNWKMFKTAQEARSLARDVANGDVLPAETGLEPHAIAAEEIDEPSSALRAVAQGQHVRPRRQCLELLVRRVAAGELDVGDAIDGHHELEPFVRRETELAKFRPDVRARPSVRRERAADAISILQHERRLFGGRHPRDGGEGNGDEYDGLTTGHDVLLGVRCILPSEIMHESCRACPADRALGRIERTVGQRPPIRRR